MYTLFGTGDLYNLKPGDCFNEVFVDDTERVVDAVSIVGCAEEHEYEVTAAVPIPGAAFPGDDAVEAMAKEKCLEAIISYVGPGAYADFGYNAYVPSTDSWIARKHTIQCLAYGIDGRTTGSSKDVGR